MKSLSPGKAGFALLFILLWSGNTVAEGPKVTAAGNKNIIIAEVGFSTPESVEYYAAEDVYLVTNINGSPFAADGNGFISKLKPDGSVIDLKWIDGTKKGVTLNAPKGAAIVGDNLFVADINQVHIFKLPGGKQKASITIQGSTFLNGITPGAGNYVYVTDSGYKNGFTASGTDAIYKVWANGKHQVIVKDKEMGRPNGILSDGNKLIVVTFGTGQVISIDATGKKVALPTPPQGGLDGLLKLKDGRFLISSWGGSAIYVLKKGNTFTVLADSLDAPADLGFDTKRNRVLVPLFKQNKVVILPL
ncbi:MAG: ATP/GTP-binding protein [Gammaproteobacteria bacterium]|nr:MAG: ATP/GTP-binding protein [Gammaproteobacteria bacterium]